MIEIAAICLASVALGPATHAAANILDSSFANEDAAGSLRIPVQVKRGGFGSTATQYGVPHT